MRLPALCLLLALSVSADEPIVLAPSRQFTSGLRMTSRPDIAWGYAAYLVGIKTPKFDLLHPNPPQMGRVMRFDCRPAAVEEIFDCIAQKSGTRWKAISPTEIVVSPDSEILIVDLIREPNRNAAD